MTTVLLVTDRHSVEESVGAEIQRRGFEVLLCPGPRPPDYVCVGGRGHRCPLAESADVIVLDCDLGSDAAHQGTRAWQLLDHYRAGGHPVVAIADSDDLPLWGRDDGIRILPRTTDPASVAAAVVQTLLDEADLGTPDASS